MWARIRLLFLGAMLVLLGGFGLSQARAGTSSPIGLTAEESAWLAQNPDKLTLFFNTEFPPIEFASDEGAFVGMGADVVAGIEKRLGVTFLKQPSSDWNQHLAALESGECAVAPTIVRTEERERFSYFTTPYATVPVVIITSRSVLGDLALEDLQDRRVGVVSGYATEKYLRDRSLGRFEIVPVANVSEGLRNVAFGQLDAFVENLAVAAYFIQLEGLPNLRVAGRTDYAFAWSLGVSREYPLLFSAVQKALADIPESELEAIRKQWIALDTKVGMDPEIVRTLKWTALFVVLLVLALTAITFFLKRRLNEKVAGLRESEEKYRELVENANSVIIRLDARCHITFFNEFAQRFFGFQKEEILGQPLLGTIVPATETSMREMAALMSGLACDSATFTNNITENVRKNGERTWISWTNKPIFDLTGKLREILCVGSDITQRKRAEEKLTLLTDILENTSDLVSTSTPDGKLTYLNQAGRAMAGWGAEESLEGRKIPDLHPAWAMHIIEAQGLPAAASTGHWEGETAVLSRDGREIPVSQVILAHRATDGGLQYFSTTMRNIAERKRAEEERISAHNLMQAAMAQSPAGILIADAPDVTIRWANPAALGVRGGTDQPLTGIEMSQHASHWQTFRTDGTPYPSHELPLSRAVLKGEVTRDEEVIIRNAQGEDRWVVVNAAPVCNREGVITSGIAIFNDITERKRAEAERAKLQAQLNQIQKMESVGRLAGGVAHDFNNMLGVILGHTEMAMAGMDPSHPLRGDLQEICKAAERSANLTRQLLAYARKQTVEPKVIDLNENVEIMLKMLRRLIGEDIELAWLPGAGLWTIRIDPSQIDQILTNLCVNARDAIRDVGKVAIETQNITLDDSYCERHPGFTPGDYVMLAVSDDGAGMDKATLDKLFEPFFTTKEIGAGTGLGLATVYGIVRQNNGFIDVYSEQVKGTTFKIYLPRHETRKELLRQPETPPPVLQGRESILLVEDEPAILKITRLMLEKLGYRVLVASTPDEALRLADEHAGQIHLLMTDVVMPGMNGRELAHKVVSRHPQVRSLFMSGYTANVIAHHGVLNEGVHFIQKPFSLKILAAKAREVLDGK